MKVTGRPDYPLLADFCVRQYDFYDWGPDDKTEEVLHIIEETCRSRRQVVTPWVPLGGTVDSYVPYPMEVTVGGATVFVLPVEDFRKL